MVPRKGNAGYHKNTLGVPLPSERKELEWVGRLGQVIKCVVICDLCLGFAACVLLGAQSSGPGLAWTPMLDRMCCCLQQGLEGLISRYRTGASRACVGCHSLLEHQTLLIKSDQEKQEF